MTGDDLIEIVQLKVFWQAGMSKRLFVGLDRDLASRNARAVGHLLRYQGKH